MADAAHAAAVVKQVAAAWGGVDVLVNNAGISQVLPIALLEEADWDAMMDVNVKGAYLFSRAVLRPMIRARRGHILSIGSFASERVDRGAGALRRRQVGAARVHRGPGARGGPLRDPVNLLAPGLLDVGLARMLPQHRLNEYRGQAALGRLGTAEEIAELAVFLASDDSGFMTGAKLVADGGL